MWGQASKPESVALLRHFYPRGLVCQEHAGCLGAGAKVRRVAVCTRRRSVIPQKTRLVCVARVRFAGLEPRKNGFLANFALQRWLDSPRILKTADYGPRWRAHYAMVRAEADVDNELKAWLQESHDIVGLQSDLRR
jgi:hypothetical protein